MPARCFFSPQATGIDGFPTSVTFGGLSSEVKEAFLKMVVPLLLHRKDLEVGATRHAPHAARRTPHQQTAPRSDELTRWTFLLAGAPVFRYMVRCALPSD